VTVTVLGPIWATHVTLSHTIRRNRRRVVVGLTRIERAATEIRPGTVESVAETFSNCALPLFEATHSIRHIRIRPGWHICIVANAPPLTEPLSRK